MGFQGKTSMGATTHRAGMGIFDAVREVSNLKSQKDVEEDIRKEPQRIGHLSLGGTKGRNEHRFNTYIFPAKKGRKEGLSREREWNKQRPWGPADMLGLKKVAV